MYNQFTCHVDGLFMIPPHIQAIAEATVGKTRVSYEKMTAPGKEVAKALEEVLFAVHSHAMTMGEKVQHNAEANVEALFEAAHAVARAKTMPAAMALQGKFLQEQLATSSELAKDLFELSSKVAKETFDSLNIAATRAFVQFKEIR